MAEANNGGFIKGLVTDFKDLAKVGLEGYLAVQTAKATNEAARTKNATVKVEVPKSEAALETQQNQTMKYVLIGVGGLAALGLVVWAVSRGSKGGS